MTKCVMHPALSMLSPELSQLMLLLGVKPVLDQHRWIRRWIKTDFLSSTNFCSGFEVLVRWWLPNRRWLALLPELPL